MFYYVFAAFFVGVEVLFEKVRKEEHPENGENDKQLYEYNCPKRSSKSHSFKAFVVELENFMQHRLPLLVFHFGSVKFLLVKYSIMDLFLWHIL